MDREVIDSDECAGLLRCTVDVVEQLARDGELPALKIGRSWIFVRADLLIFLAEKARAEAEERRTKRQASHAMPIVRSKRRTPPVLPTLPRSA